MIPQAQHLVTTINEKRKSNVSAFDKYFVGLKPQNKIARLLLVRIEIKSEVF